MLSYNRFRCRLSPLTSSSSSPSPSNKSRWPKTVSSTLKVPSLETPFPSSCGAVKLLILRQPAKCHRAGYQSEGSRGLIKDVTGESHPTVKLAGYNQAVPLKVFMGTGVGDVRPHTYYKACKVTKTSSMSAVERDVEGTTVIELMLDPKQDMVAVVDCVGLLKLRNIDVERQFGIPRSKRSTCARLIFRVNLPKANGFCTLQLASTPIICSLAGKKALPDKKNRSCDQNMKTYQTSVQYGKANVPGTIDHEIDDDVMTTPSLVGFTQTWSTE